MESLLSDLQRICKKILFFFFEFLFKTCSLAVFLFSKLLPKISSPTRPQPHLYFEIIKTIICPRPNGGSTSGPDIVCGLATKKNSANLFSYQELHSHHDCAESCKLFHHTWQNKSFPVHYCSPGGSSHNDLHGEAPSERGFFFRLQVYKRVGVSLVELYKRIRKSVIKRGILLL